MGPCITKSYLSLQGSKLCCDFCGKYFATLWNYTQHIKKCSQGYDPVTKSTKKVCEQCGKRYARSSKKEYANHIQHCQVSKKTKGKTTV